MKKQIWFRPDELDLVTQCLSHCRYQLNQRDTCLITGHVLGRQFTTNRIDDLASKFKRCITPSDGGTE